jgi:hypothetical protein
MFDSHRRLTQLAAPARAKPSRPAGRGHIRRPWWTWIQAFAALATVIASVIVPAAFVANAAGGTLYLDQATDPHGEVWLTGTTDGTATGPMDPGTNPASATVGHLWATDVPSGFCRVDGVVQPDGSIVNQYARNVTGGCVHTGQKSSQPVLDPRRNADGTFYVYTCDWAVFSNGCYRMTYNPGTQIMTNTELLAAGRFPQSKKPFATALGQDGSLYVSSDITQYLYKFTTPNSANVGDQTATIVGQGNATQRARAITWSCWEPFRGGTTGLPSCAQSAAAGNPAPDLIFDQKTQVAVIMDVVKCAGVPIDPATAGPANGATPACTAIQTPVKVLTAMGAWTQGGWDRPSTPVPAVGTVTSAMPAYGPNFNPNVIYISNSTGATSEIVRYTIATNTQDSYSNFATFPDGTSRQYSFAFSPTQAPDGTMYIGDDPCAGAQAFCGALWRVPAGAPADVVGAPGAPATPPPPAAQKVGTLYGSGVTLPNGGAWLPLYDAAGKPRLNPDGTPTGHLWQSDNLAGFCRIDVNPTPGASSPPTASGAPFFENGSTCIVSAKKPGQPALDPVQQPDGTHYVYLPDDSTNGEGLFRVTYDPNGTVCRNPDNTLKGPESVCNSVNIAPGQGLAGQRASASAIDPSTGTVYVGFRTRNVGAAAEIARVTNPTSATPTVDFVSKTTRNRPVFTLAFIGADMYIGNGGGLDFLPKPATCPANGCVSVNLLNVRAPRGLATDGVDKIYMAGPAIPAGCPPTCPAPGTTNTNVTVFSAATQAVTFYSSQGAFLDGSLGSYDVVDSLTLDPQGNLFVGDDPSVLGLPAQQGRLWKVPFTGQEPLPAIQSKPHNPTNIVNPSFQFASADLQATFRCSLVPFGAADAFSNCTSPVTYGTNPPSTTPVQQTATTGRGPLADGPYTFKVTGTNPTTGLTSFAAAYGFTIDTVAPVVTINSAPASPSNVNTPSFTFSANKTGTQFQCSLSTTLDAFNFCNSPMAYPAQPDGAYTFKVQGIDPAGNVTTVSKALVIDTVAPTVTANPAGGSFTTAQSVVLTASDPAPSSGTPTIFYTLDGTTPTTTSTSGLSPVTVNVSSSATLKYFAKDPAGNAGAVASQVYAIGSVSITQNPPALSNNNTPAFAFTSTVAGATFQCSLVLQTATDAFSPCTSPITYPAQPDGAYRFVAKDSAGSSAQFLFIIDTTPPVVTITSNPANPDTTSAATFAFSGTDANGVAGFQCSFGLQSAADAFSACTSPITYSSLTDGNYVFKVKATDKAGNTSAPDTYLFSVSAVAPPSATVPQATLTGLITAQTGTSATTTTAGPITASTNTVPVTISWTGTACQSGATNCNIDHYNVKEAINGSGFATAVTLPTPNATNVTLNLKPSPTNNSVPATNYQFEVQAVDKAGNLSPFAIGTSFIVPDTDNSFQTSFNGTWSGVNLTGAFGGSVQQSSTAGATANPSNAAPATSLAFVSTLGPDRGKAQIKIDGQIVTTVDLYAPTQTTAQVVWSINGLAPGVNHSIQIVSTGTKNPSATAAKVDYDAILAVH